MVWLRSRVGRRELSNRGPPIRALHLSALLRLPVALPVDVVIQPAELAHRPVVGLGPGVIGSREVPPLSWRPLNLTSKSGTRSHTNKDGCTSRNCEQTILCSLSTSPSSLMPKVGAEGNRIATPRRKGFNRRFQGYTQPQQSRARPVEAAARHLAPYFARQLDSLFSGLWRSSAVTGQPGDGHPQTPKAASGAGFGLSSGAREPAYPGQQRQLLLPAKLLLPAPHSPVFLSFHRQAHLVACQSGALSSHQFGQPMVPLLMRKLSYPAWISVLSGERRSRTR